jgi:hypothetical protein
MSWGFGWFYEVETTHLDAESNFFSRSRSSRIGNTVKGASQRKIGFCAKTFCGAASSAGWQAEGLRVFHG